MSFDPSLSNNPTLPGGKSPYDEINAVLNRAALESALPGLTTLDEFRKHLPERLAGSWNHYGTHKAIFESNVRVTGVSHGFCIDQCRDDPIVLKQVQMRGRLVDFSANNDMGTQVFFDQVQFGNAVVGLRLARRKRMTCRFLNLERNAGSKPK